MNGDWSNRLTVSGLATVDALWMNRVPTAVSRYQSATRRRHTDIILSNANLYFDSKINCWTNVHVGTTYKGESLRHHDQPFVQGIAGGIANNAFVGTAPNIDVDEAFVTIMDSARSPYYLRAGKQYVQFGNYDRFPITASLTQLLATTRADAAIDVGFVDTTGWNGGMYIFRGLPGPVPAAAANARINNGGLHLGYAGEYNAVAYNIDVDYLSNMIDTAYLMGARTNYVTRVGGWSLHGDMQNGPFDASIDWVSAAKRFALADYAGTVSTRGAKPSAFGLGAGYSFCSAGLPSRFGIGYQNSKDAGRLGTGAQDNLPKRRWLAQYGVEWGRYVDVALQLVSDRDYSVAAGGEGDRRTAGILRLGVRFA